jgi:hypothetical protein
MSRLSMFCFMYIETPPAGRAPFLPRMYESCSSQAQNSLRAASVVASLLVSRSNYILYVDIMESARLNRILFRYYETAFLFNTPTLACCSIVEQCMPCTILSVGKHCHIFPSSTSVIIFKFIEPISRPPLHTKNRSSESPSESTLFHGIQFLITEFVGKDIF